MTTIVQTLAYASLCWSCFVVVVQLIGSLRIFRKYSSIPKPAVAPTLPQDEIPHVTVLRPAKGLDPSLYSCLASTFYQSYPKEKLTICFCVSSRDDPAYPTIRQLLDDFPSFDAKLYVEEEDPVLHGRDGRSDNLGPNPKIRNLSRAYREAKGDIIWVMDSNVWVAEGVAGRMVDQLCGYLPGGKHSKPHKLVHLLPIVVDTTSSESSPPSETRSVLGSLVSQGGGRIEEMYMATTHAKFYSAFNTVGLAPCVVGKSNMFRKSHLDRVTDPAQNPILPRSAEALPTGLDHFSTYICEDHLIGDLLWRSALPGFNNHSLVWGDLAVQPMAGMSVPAYLARRVRWLRVRKWTVLAATLIEPGVESLLCSLHLSFAITTIPWFHSHFGIPQTWAQLGICWFSVVALWATLDWFVTNRLHAGYSIAIDENAPKFAQGTERGGVEKRPLGEWLLAWMGREFTALPIWVWAVLLGTTVTWRGKSFRVRSDMSAIALDPEGSQGAESQAQRKTE